jgi:aspartyl-tRNA(Asn)/glutamyl-tRNA(Gln) amidotransferase subunit A
MLENFIPPYESTVTRNLLDAGAIFLGKLNLDQFAMGSANLTSYFGRVNHPTHHDYVTGGSSGGSACAVRADLCLAATGTDTGGSIRQPAAFCDIVGLKPTYGRCSRYGIIAFASSLDQAGPMTKTVKDAAIMLNIMASHDHNDSTSSPINSANFTASIGDSIKGMKIGVAKQYLLEQDGGLPHDIIASFEQAKQILVDAGADIIDVSLPHTKYALPAYYIIAPAEASANLARYDGVRYTFRADIKEGEASLDDMYSLTRSQGFGDEVKKRILLGGYVLSAGYYDAYYKKAQRVRTLIREDFNAAFMNVDAILTPTTPTPSFKHDASLTDLEMYRNDILTVPASMAGVPAISVPCGYTSCQEHLPLGVQLIGNMFDEHSILKIAHVIEAGQ